MSSDCEDYEELDSFTENIIKRTQERQKLLNNETIDGSQDYDLSGIASKTSLKNDFLVNDNKTNIKLNESPTKPIVDTTSKLIENLSKLTPNRERVPLSQRLNSIARTYNYEDSENVEYIDDSDGGNEDVESKTPISRSPMKSMRQTTQTNEESPPKKRLLLNERLKQMARNYDIEQDFEERKEVVVETKSNGNYRSPQKLIKQNVENKVQNEESKPYFAPEKTFSRSPIKKQTIPEEKIEEMSSSVNIVDKSPIKVSPVKQQIENKNLKEKLSQFGFQKCDDSSNSESLIYNSRNNRKDTPVTIGSSTTVSEVRKQFEQNLRSDSMAPKPETLSLKAKTNLFEKAIEAENVAKSKQYWRKRNAPEVKPVVKTDDKFSTDKTIATNSVGNTIKRQKSSENFSETKTTVANNIQLRKQILEEKLFGSETTTANAYKKELELRQQEIELLKRPLKRNESEKLNDVNKEVIKNEVKIEKEMTKQTDLEITAEDRQQIANQSSESIDNETAHQTVCDAFQEIEGYSNQLSDEDSFNDFNYDSNYDSLKSDSKLAVEKKINICSESPTKTRLYPDLFVESNELCAQTYQMNPPEKPPRLYEPTPATDNTPFRTISFYRKEQALKKSEYVDTTKALNENSNKKKESVDLLQRNCKLQEQIDDLKEKVEETNRIAGQASQALNLCLEREEFKGSTERVEAEKVLLLSGQRRIAFLNEIQKLKNKLNDKNTEPESSKGKLTLSDLKLKVKPEFFVARAKGNVQSVHHFICLVYNGANVMPTNLLNTENDIKNGCLDFDFGVQTELCSDFHIVVHIYELITNKHNITHETKYHIKKTPKKNKSTMKSPSVRSPGGPNAVMSTSFRLVGALKMNLTNYFRNTFQLENNDINCPLDGNIHLKSKLTVVHPFRREGFFDCRDGSGFWNMRWVVLNGDTLGFWRFPEDETTKSPLAVIDLKKCINPRIRLIPTHLSHICMRKNTIAMITVDNLSDSNNIFTKGGSIPRSRPQKYLLSGENKQKCIEWSEYLTNVLQNIRVWNAEAVKPYPEEEYEKLLMKLQ